MGSQRRIGARPVKTTQTPRYLQVAFSVGVHSMADGPLHWISKRQSITTRSSTESEIYATEKYFKILHNIVNILEEMDLRE